MTVVSPPASGPGLPARSAPTSSAARPRTGLVRRKGALERRPPRASGTTGDNARHGLMGRSCASGSLLFGKQISTSRHTTRYRGSRRGGPPPRAVEGCGLDTADLIAPHAPSAPRSLAPSRRPVIRTGRLPRHHRFGPTEGPTPMPEEVRGASAAACSTPAARSTGTDRSDTSSRCRRWVARRSAETGKNSVMPSKAPQRHRLEPRDVVGAHVCAPAVARRRRTSHTVPPITDSPTAAVESGPMRPATVSQREPSCQPAPMSRAFHSSDPAAVSHR